MTFTCMAVDKSFVYIKISRGPRILPCGTPLVIGLGIDVKLFTVVA